MKTMTGMTQPQDSGVKDVLAMAAGEQARVHGLVHTLRDLGDVRFMLLRMPQGVLQCVLTGDGPAVREGDAVRAEGEVARDERAPGGAELHVKALTVLSRAAEAMPVPIGKNRMNLSMDTDLSLRFVKLRFLQGLCPASRSRRPSDSTEGGFFYRLQGLLRYRAHNYHSKPECAYRADPVSGRNRRDSKNKSR